MRKIAIIGGGAAGSVAAWVLNKKYDVTLYEANSYLGGHAYTHELTIDGEKISVDMGVEYYHERLSPNFSALLKYFNLESYIAPLSFRAFNPFEPNTDYWSNNHCGGKLKSKLYDEMNRFHLDMIEVINDKQSKEMSMKDFLDSRGYSNEFREKALLALMSTFSGCKKVSLDYSLTYFALSFNMNLLSFFTPSHWRKLKGGIHVYLKNIQQSLKGKVFLNTKVTSVEKMPNGIKVTLADNVKHYYDDVIFACQAYIAKSLIKNSSTQQQACLSVFEYVDVQSTLHSDSAAVSCQTLSDEYCQFQLATTSNSLTIGSLTRVNHHLHAYQHLVKPIYVSFDNRDRIDPLKIISKKDWKLPKLRPIDIQHKHKMSRIQGKDNLWFCGTDYSLTGHEGAIVSGLVIANHLGADYPFKDNYLAKAQFDLIKSFMGIYTRKQKLAEHVIGALFIISKYFNLHQHLSGRFIKDLLF